MQTVSRIRLSRASVWISVALFFSAGLALSVNKRSPMPDDLIVEGERESGLLALPGATAGVVPLRSLQTGRLPYETCGRAHRAGWMLIRQTTATTLHAGRRGRMPPRLAGVGVSSVRSLEACGAMMTRTVALRMLDARGLHPYASLAPASDMVSLRLPGQGDASEVPGDELVEVEEADVQERPHCWSAATRT